MENIKRGFTLIELLVVVAIVGILISLAFPVLSRVQHSAKVSAARMDIKSIEVAIGQYYSEYRRLPIPGAFHSTGHHNWRGISYHSDWQGLNIPGGGWHHGMGSSTRETESSWRLALLTLSTLQGGNEFEGQVTGLNPRESQFLNIQEGRPLGHFMDPWSKGTSVFEDRDNMLYGLILDHNLNGRIVLWETQRVDPSIVIENRLASARSPGPNRMIEARVDDPNYDDVYPPDVEKLFKHILR